MCLRKRPARIPQGGMRAGYHSQGPVPTVPRNALQTHKAYTYVIHCVSVICEEQNPPHPDPRGHRGADPNRRREGQDKPKLDHPGSDLAVLSHTPPLISSGTPEKVYPPMKTSLALSLSLSLSLSNRKVYLNYLSRCTKMCIKYPSNLGPLWKTAYFDTGTPFFQFHRQQRGGCVTSRFHRK